MISMPFIKLPFILPIYTVEGPRKFAVNKYRSWLSFSKDPNVSPAYQELITGMIMSAYMSPHGMYVVEPEIREWLDYNCKKRWACKIDEREINVVDILTGKEPVVSIVFKFRSKNDAAMFKMFWC